MLTEYPERLTPRKYAGALTIALIVWLVTGLSAGERLPAVSWWIVVWAADHWRARGRARTHHAGGL